MKYRISKKRNQYARCLWLADNLGTKEMKTYREWIEERQEKTKKEETKYYSAIYENKEVRIHNNGDTICCDWYINGKLIKNPNFPKEIAFEIYLYLQTLFFKPISDRMLFGITCTMEKYLPYLKDGDEDVNLTHIELIGEITSNEQCS